MQEYLFSYGTLQKEKVQQELFGRVLTGKKDILEGYKIAAIEITDENFLSKGEEKLQRTLLATNNNYDKVEGTVFEISHAELMQADKYEPDNYQRIKVTLRSGIKAWV